MMIEEAKQLYEINKQINLLQTRAEALKRKLRQELGVGNHKVGSYTIAVLQRERNVRWDEGVVSQYLQDQGLWDEYAEHKINMDWVVGAIDAGDLDQADLLSARRATVDFPVYIEKVADSDV